MLNYKYPVISGCVLVIFSIKVFAQFDWQIRDGFDDITSRMGKVGAENCKVVDRNALFLPQDSVTHVPNIRQIGIDPVLPNRTNLLQLHNMALSRAFFYSFILQRAADDDEPGFMYYFLSSISDVAANRFINSSAIYFSPNMSFTPSYKGFFNKTMPLFAPRAFRSDDFNDPFHLERISTLNTIEAIDLGAIPNNSMSLNYTHGHYKINDWYSAWLPDLTKRQDSKTTYSVQITHGNGTNETFTWHGPPAASDIPGPVKWFKPYFDCGRSNKWVFGATVPIPDIFPRHTQWRHIEIPTYVAVAVMEIDFERIDINQCPTGEGNPPPNRYAGTARCKNQTTEVC
ncbi:g-protein coupled receptor [Trichonephila clavata]|uniref:G-protein coupled receptor n=1 Tax=Trichonephila clavata TaxID=2740835 RepID=A0A8X6GVV0_TRICU|nr:g-protein coupled receptor [Trichonephila clavata]